VVIDTSVVPLPESVARIRAAMDSAQPAAAVTRSTAV
jgi:hypothetical protein